MNKWLAKFSAAHQENQPDIPDILPSVSGLSGPFSKNPPENAPLPEAPTPPLQPAWLVVYRDQSGRLRGGSDEREAGTVQTCTWDGIGWTVALTNGQTLPLRTITAVSQTDIDGHIVAAWTVREHGYDGQRRPHA